MNSLVTNLDASTYTTIPNSMYTTVVPSTSLYYTPADRMEIRDQVGNLCVQIDSSGKVTFGDGMTSDEASRKFYETVGCMMQASIEHRAQQIAETKYSNPTQSIVSWTLPKYMEQIGASLEKVLDPIGDYDRAKKYVEKM